jgi:hypothetical protein
MKSGGGARGSVGGGGVGRRAQRRRWATSEAEAEGAWRGTRRGGLEEGWNDTHENGKRSLRGTGGNGTWEYRWVDRARITKHFWTAWTVHAAASRCETAFLRKRRWVVLTRARKQARIVRKMGRAAMVASSRSLRRATAHRRPGRCCRRSNGGGMCGRTRT